MKPREIYLDNNASTRVLPEVAEAVHEALLNGCGNPSSAHRAGRRARRRLWEARESVARLLSADPNDIVFTSGASEANNLVLQSLLARPLERYRLITSAVEHSSVLKAAEALRRLGRQVVVLPVDSNGLVSEDRLVQAVAPGRTLVSIQWANNETGVVQPIARLAERARGCGALFHTDAVQAVGKVPVNLGAVPVDFLSLSGHKLHGPLGVGALVVRDRRFLRPLMFGGSQEGSLRPGTENIPGIAGLGVALTLRNERFEAVAAATRDLQTAFEAGLARRGLVGAVNGLGADRLPNTSNIRFLDMDGELLTARLDQLGVRCSQSSACTNRRPEPSYVLRAMGLSERQAYASVRFASSELNTMMDVDDAVGAVSSVHADLLRFAVA